MRQPRQPVSRPRFVSRSRTGRARGAGRRAGAARAAAHHRESGPGGYRRRARNRRGGGRPAAAGQPGAGRPAGDVAAHAGCSRPASGTGPGSRDRAGLRDSTRGPRRKEQRPRCVACRSPQRWRQNAAHTGCARRRRSRGVRRTPHFIRPAHSRCLARDGHRSRFQNGERADGANGAAVPEVRLGRAPNPVLRSRAGRGTGASRRPECGVRHRIATRYARRHLGRLHRGS